MVLSEDYLKKVFKDYLKDGYFDKTGNIHTELIDTKAEEIVKTFGDCNMKYTKIRKFFQHARQAQRVYESLPYEERKEEKSIKDLKEKIVKLKPIVYYKAKGQEKIPLGFIEFINKNIELIENCDINKVPDYVIRGFIPHFEAVIAYFKYNFN